MCRLFWLLSVMLLPLFGFNQGVGICLNKPGITLQSLPENIGKAKILFSQKNVPCLYIKAPGKKVVRALETSVDLHDCYPDPKDPCLTSWKLQNSCKAETLRTQARIDRDFYAKIICQNGCEHREFLYWDKWWDTPTKVRLRTEFNTSFGYKSLKEAIKGLEIINAYLHRVCPKDRFPTGYGMGRTPDEIFYVDAQELPPDYHKIVRKILYKLTKNGALQGLASQDIAAIVQRSLDGAKIYYSPKTCGGDEKWHAQSGGFFTKLRFDARGCVHVEILH